MRIDDDMRLDIAGADIHQHGFLPVAAAYCRSIDLIGLVNKMVPSQMVVKPGQIVQAMVLDTLSGRSPLYRLSEFMAEQDVELLIGEKIDPEKFNDTNVGRALDAIFKAGSSKVLTECGVRATELFKLDTSVISYDTTSTNVWGDYYDCESKTPPLGPVVTHGYSKDHRPDLKQFMTELLCVERGIPIFGRSLDGNSSDKTSNNEMLGNISSIMAKNGVGPGAFVYVADSAMVTESNLESVGSNLFITRLPANYKECKVAISKAVEADEWAVMGVLAETKETKNRPSARYKSYETSVNIHGKKYRAIVVHSSAHDKRRQKKLEKDITASEKEINRKIGKQSIRFSCQPDADKAAKALNNISTKLHSVKASVNAVEVKKRGRPPAGGSSPTQTRYDLTWELVLDDNEVQTLKKIAGCFVLLTNVPIDGEMGMDSTASLRTYKGQYGVESDFAFLKDPLVVNDIFLKTPSRIDALGMVLIISLMIWRLMERSMRAYVENEKTTLPGWNRQKTKLPTAFMMTTIMTGIMVVATSKGKCFLSKPKLNQMIYLEALGLDPEVFTNSSSRCRPIIPKKMTSGG
jgi:transposase